MAAKAEALHVHEPRRLIDAAFQDVDDPEERALLSAQDAEDAALILDAVLDR